MLRELAITALLLATLTAGHLAAGEDITKEGYVVDLGYEPAQPVTNQRTSFLLALVNATTQQPASQDSVHVRITRTDVVFSGEFTARPNTPFAYTFAQPGEYDMQVTFRNDGDDLVSHTYTLDVQDSGPIGKYGWGLYITIGMAVLIIVLQAALLWHDRRNV
jgi:hypothetical protein